MTMLENLDRWQHGGPPEPPRLMHVVGEVFPFAADRRGIWLLSGTWPWATLPIADDSSPVAACEDELEQRGALALTVIGPHQSSARVDGPAFITTHFAVVACADPVRSRWPQAEPVSPRVLHDPRVGKPPTHPANQAPSEIRMWDALVHSLRHIAFQLSPWGDAELASKLNNHWLRHLTDWEPDLYRLYDRVHSPA
jgi:hypothetical protein